MNKKFKTEEERLEAARKRREDGYDKNYQSSYRKRNPIKVRDSQRRTKYGIEPDDFNEMLTNQNGLCAICGSEIDDSAAVDHDHATGRIRGLLCRGCNLGLAWFKDSQEILSSAIMYLDEDN